MSKPSIRAFICYSQDTELHVGRVLDLARALRANGIDVEVDQFHLDELLDWPRWCRAHISREKSDFVLCICTAEFQRRIDGEVPPKRGKGLYWEGSLLDDEIYDEKGNRRVVPILLDDEPEASIPGFLRGWTFCRLRAFTLGDPGFKHVLRIVTGQARVEKPPLGPVPNLPPEPLAEAASPPSSAASRVRWGDELRIYGEGFAGRRAELASLDEALAGGRVRVYSLWAEGGAGKTRLLFKWLTQVRDDGWRGLGSVFVHSFYSQGSEDSGGASSEVFFQEALDHFGYDGPAILDTTERGRKLASLLVRERGLLILDGMEPLQHPVHHVDRGRLKDPSIRELILSLSNAPSGLCLITSRQEVVELRDRAGAAVVQKPLDRLNVEDGVALLRQLGVQGPEKELREAATDFRGHAYSLMLLGAYLRDATSDHEIRRRHEIALLDEDPEHGSHTQHMFAAYESYLGEESPEVAVLRLLGLFDRPAASELVDVLRAREAVVYDWPEGARQPDATESPTAKRMKDHLPDVTAPLLDLSPAKWRRVLRRLTEFRLLSTTHGAHGSSYSLDSHHLLREYFAGQLRMKSLRAWRAGHRRLYEYLTSSAPYWPEGIEALQPLYQAVVHGCRTDLHQEACYDVYHDRILRGTEQGGFYSFRMLGAIGANLGAVACFFNEPWSALSSNLSDEAKPWLLNDAAFCLRALGRLSEALEPMRAAGEFCIAQGEWGNSAVAASNLSELELTLGHVSHAVTNGEKSVTYSNRSGHGAYRIMSRTCYADALHQAGRRDEALRLFREAEAMQAEQQPWYPRLYLLRGFRFCDLLLSGVERTAWVATMGLKSMARGPSYVSLCDEVEERAGEWLEWRLPTDSLLNVALEHLARARAGLYRALLGNSSGGRRDVLTVLAASKEDIEKALGGLRHAGQMDEFPRGLLIRALFVVGNARASGSSLDEALASARQDLDEAWEIAERGPMRLHMADIQLTRARLFRDRKALEAAAELIEETGYHRRDEELADAREAAKSWP
jgi:tetratricopeptide (TPR) repeat protein